MPAGWHHADLNIHPTISLKIQHVDSWDELATGMLRTVECYPLYVISPLFGGGLYVILTQLVYDIEEAPFKSCDDQSNMLTDMFLPVFEALNLCLAKESIAVNLKDGKVRRLKLKALRALIRDPVKITKELEEQEEEMKREWSPSSDSQEEEESCQ